MIFAQKLITIKNDRNLELEDLYSWVLLLLDLIRLLKRYTNQENFTSTQNIVSIFKRWILKRVSNSNMDLGSFHFRFLIFNKRIKADLHILHIKTFSENMQQIYKENT